MAEGTFSSEGHAEVQAELAKMYNMQQKITSSLTEYSKQLAKVSSLQRDLNSAKKVLLKSQEKEKALADEINKRISKHNSLSGDKKKKSQDEIDALKKQLTIQTNINTRLVNQTNEIENHIKREREQINLLNTTKATWASIGKGVKSVGKSLYGQLGYALEQEKSLRVAELSMGVLSKQSGIFRTNLRNAAVSTNLLGIDTKALAQIQQSYSEQLGRGVVLSQENLEAMSQLASGTMMGTEGATEMATQMARFGKSAKESVAFVEDVMNNSNTMGLNAEKVLKNTNKGLRMMNRVSFKNGVKGMAKMAAHASKLGYSMDSIDGTVDKLFNPEGAVEMAAQLQVLGGEWSKIADPFTLMYQARNAPDELAKSLYEAAGASAVFNKTTGEFDVPAMELHRLKEVAKATGLNYEEMAESAKNFAGIKTAKTQIRGNFDDKTREYLSTIADIGKGGIYKINIEDKNGEIIPTALKDLNKLTKEEIKNNITRIKAEKASLEKRGKDSQTFDETFQNIINQFKTVLLPAFAGLSKGLEVGLRKFTEWDEKSGFSEHLMTLSTSLGKFLGENPIETLITTIAGIGLFKAAQWILNGKMLALGFNSSAGGMGGAGGMGTSSPIGGGMFQKGSPKNVKMKKGMGRGGAMALGGMALSAGRHMLMEDPDSDLGKGIGVGAGALSGAGTGAMIGSMIFPGVGTAIGGVLGGLIGGGMAAYDEGLFNTKKSANAGKTHDDFVMRPGQPAASFTSKDTLIGLKDGGPIEKSFSNLEGGGKGGGMKHITFSPLRIEFGTLNLNTGTSQVSLDLENDPILARQISRIIMEEVSKAVGGGKLNPNVV